MNATTKLPTGTRIHTIGRPDWHGVLVGYETLRTGLHAKVQFEGKRYADLIRAGWVRAS